MRSSESSNRRSLLRHQQPPSVAVAFVAPIEGLLDRPFSTVSVLNCLEACSWLHQTRCLLFLLVLTAQPGAQLEKRPDWLLARKALVGGASRGRRLHALELPLEMLRGSGKKLCGGSGAGRSRTFASELSRVAARERHESNRIIPPQFRVVS